MEEKQVPESIASVTIKPDYPPSEYCSSEPPPAYHRAQSSAVQVAKIIAVTVVVVSFVLGIFILASAYVTATASCRQLEQDLELLSEVADRFEGSNNEGPLQPEALKAEEPKHSKRQSDALETSKKAIKDIDDNSVDSSSDSNSDTSSSNDAEEEQKVHFKLPLQLDFDDLAGAMIAKNQRSKMNCIVEKKRAEEVVDHQPKTVRLPFGVNLTTDPRFERLTGERMVIICESGNMQSAQPQQPEKPQTGEDDDDDDSEQDTIMIQPVMIPIPHTSFQTHMPQQMPPQEQPFVQLRAIHPMEALRPPMPNMRPPVENMRPPMEQFRPNVEGMRPPMRLMEPRPIMEQTRPMMEQPRPMMEQPRPMMEQPRPVMEQPRPPMERILLRPNFEPVSQSLEPQRSEEVDESRLPMFIPRQIQIHVEPQQPQQQTDASPNPIIRHIIEQIIAQKIMDAQKASQENQQQNRDQEVEARAIPVNPYPERPMPNRFPSLPEEVLTKLKRLPSNDGVIVAVSEPESPEEESSEESGESQEMVGKPYMRSMPINIPVNMMQQQVPDQEEPQAAASEETRPHYVQPRSVSNEEPKSRVARSVNPLLPEKRVKRCACDCAC